MLSTSTTLFAGFLALALSVWVLRWCWRYTPSSGSHKASGSVRLAVPVKFFKALDKAEIPVVGKQLLTGNELEFWGRLRAALPEYSVLPQVAMGALVQSGKARDWDTIKLFQSKICDFVLVSAKTGKVVAIVELDDITHSANKDFERDKLLASAGIGTLRFHSRAKPDKATIRQALALVL